MAAVFICPYHILLGTTSVSEIELISLSTEEKSRTKVENNMAECLDEQYSHSSIF